MGIHAWRQTQTMTVVENFAFEDFNLLNPRINSRGDGDGIFRMEFPIMQWSFALFYRAFGTDLTIIRLLSFLIYLTSVLGFYRLIKNYHQTQNLSALAAWCFAWSPVLFFYSVNPLPDNLALCATIWSMAYLKIHQSTGSIKSLLIFSAFLSLATAVKLPFAVFGAGYIPVFLRNFSQRGIKTTIIQAWTVLLIVAPALAWYAWVIPQWANSALIGGVGAEESVNYSKATSNIWGILHSILPELLINYGSVIFFLIGVGLFLKSKQFAKYSSEIAILIAVTAYYLYEVNMIGLAHDYYLFPFLPLIFLVVANGLKLVLQSDNQIFRNISTLALLILPLTAFLRADGRWEPMGSEKQIHVHKEELRSLTADDKLIVAGNDPSTHMFLYHIGKKGWTFEQDWLKEENLIDHISNGAKYLYCNSTQVDRNPSIAKHLESPIFDKDGIRVYPLKPLNDS